MRKYRLKISQKDFEQLRELVFSDAPEEAGAFALAGIAESNRNVDILVRRVLEIPKDLMPVQNEVHLEVSPKAINGLAALCDANGLTAVFCHSHPGGGLRYSPSDDYGESRLVNTLRNFVPSKVPIASLLFTPDNVTGRVWLPEKNQPILLDEIIVIGSSIQRINLSKGGSSVLPDTKLYDRQVRAFGMHGQHAIAETKVGIVGLGGTGSPVAEQLVRLGVSNFTLIDPDKISPTNITRVYGSYSKSITSNKLGSKYKVDIIAAHLKKIKPSALVQTINKSIVLTDAAQALLDCDVVFLCTDEHWGRSIVNQIAYQYLIPTINLGVRITSDSGTISHAIGAIDMLRPDKPCLWCKQFLNAERIRAESLPSKERSKLLKEGYVDDIDTPAPTVISFTSSIASQGVSLFLHLATNFMGISGDISRVNQDFLTGSISRGTTQINKNCICQKVKGFGDLTDIPTIKKPPI